MEDRGILDVIQGLAAEERWIKDQSAKGTLDPDTGSIRLREVESRLDEMWTTLRRRRALRAAGLDPDEIDLTDPGSKAS